MYKRVLGVVLIMTFILAGCSLNIENQMIENNIPPKLESPEIEIDQIKEQIEKMSLNEKIGQMVMVGLDGYELDDNAKEMIEEYNVGGFILFKDNMDNPQQILNLMNQLKGANTDNIPLFFSIDEEGGSVSRMPDDLIKLPSSRIIGQKNDKELSYKIGRIIAGEIKSFGFNMNFAPVLDIDSNPNNPVIGDRSFGSSERIVSELGIQTMKGMQSNNIISVVKHFPGHGDTSVDSHIGLPTVDKDLDSLLDFELVPFKEAIENNVDVVMVAHIIYDKIDPQNPATLSKPIITDLLRDELNFDGVVITDDMTMGAIMENYDIGEAAVKSINAGTDIVLVCHGYENEIKILNAIRDAVKAGTISEERIDESLYRILNLKEKYDLNDSLIQDVDIEKINDDIKEVLDIIR